MKYQAAFVFLYLSHSKTQHSHLFDRICVILTLALIVIAYVKDGTTTNEPVKIENSVDKQNENNGTVAANFVSEVHSIPPDVVMHCPKASVPKRTIFDDIVECFSLRKNFQILTSVDKPANAVPIVDGLK